MNYKNSTTFIKKGLFILVLTMLAIVVNGCIKDNAPVNETGTTTTTTDTNTSDVKTLLTAGPWKTDKDSVYNRSGILVPAAAPTQGTFTFNSNAIYSFVTSDGKSTTLGGWKIDSNGKLLLYLQNGTLNSTVNITVSATLLTLVYLNGPNSTEPMAKSELKH